MVMRVGYVTVDMLVPAPDSPKAQPKLTIEAKREMVIVYIYIFIYIYRYTYTPTIFNRTQQHH